MRGRLILSHPDGARRVGGVLLVLLITLALQPSLALSSQRPAVQQAMALKAAHAFRTVLDDETRTALFPQNANS
ncbi:MAG: hypothetical protein KL863_18820 [Rhizobium sp.]|nr:hypothetical protein [Rhizobium sp.]